MRDQTSVRPTAVKMRAKVRESDVQRAIMDLLAAEKIPFWRMNTGAISGEHNGKRRFFRFGQKGMADLLAAPPAHWDTPMRYWLWIEVKAFGGKQSSDQKAFEQYVTHNGMFYVLADSVDWVRGWLRSIEVIK